MKRKNRLLALLLSVALILTFMPMAAFADGNEAHTYTAPTGLKWDPNEPGVAMFKLTDNTRGYYLICLFRDGERVMSYHMGDISDADHSGCRVDSEGYYYHDFKADFDADGEYSFYLVVAKDQDSIDEGVTSEWSDTYTYTKTGKTVLGTPQNVRWDDANYGIVKWDPVENAGGYRVELLVNGEERFGIRESLFIDDGYHEGECSWDLSDQIGDLEENSYRVRVQALSNDLTRYAHGELSEQSAALTGTSAMGLANEAVAVAANNADEDNINEIVNDLKGSYSSNDDKDILRDAIQSSVETQSNIQTLEGMYAQANNIEVKAPVSEVEGIDPDKIEVVGAGLSAEAGSSVGLKVTNTDNDPEYDTDIYSNVISFNMSLTSEKGVVKTEITELDIPVTITLPVPAGMNTAFLYVLHYLSDRTVEVITPEILSNGAIAKFTITHFSTFAFAEGKTRTISFNANGGTVDPKSKVVTDGQAYGELPTPVYSGYTFEGWFTAAAGGEKITSDMIVSIAENQTLYAHWKSNDQGGGGGATPGGNTTPEPETGDEEAVKAEAKTVSDLIGKIDPENPAEAAVTEARQAYDKLSNEAKALITADEVSKLEAAEKKLADNKAAAEKEAQKAVGAETTVAAGTVKVTSSESKTVAFTATDTSKKNITVPATVTIAGEEFAVTAIKAGAFKGSAATKVTIGKNVKKIAKNAFAGSKVKTVVVKSTKLTKASVKGSLKGSKVKTVQVKVGTRKQNKTYVKKYKKIFTKANAGRKVVVK